MTTPAPGFILTSGSTVVLVAGADVEHHRAPLQRVLAEGGGIADVVETLVASGVSSAPDFGSIVSLDDSHQIVVRGAVEAIVESGEPPEQATIAGRGVATWREETIVGASAFDLRHPDGLAVSVVCSPAGAAADAALAATPPIEEPDRREPSGPVAKAVVAPPPPPEPEPQPAESGEPAQDPGSETDGESSEEPYDWSHLTERTRYFGVEAAAVRTTQEVAVPGPPPGPAAKQPPSEPTGPSRIGGPPPLIDSVPTSFAEGPPSVEQAAAPELPGDHDGLTVGSADPSVLAARVALRAQGRTQGATGGVASILCPTRHPNPPTADQCRTCHVSITDRTIHHLPRPSRGRLTFADGRTVELDRTQYIGRQPRPSASETDEVMNLLTLPTNDPDLSRLHAEIRLEGWEVFIIDRSTNGTWVEVPGEPLTRLRPGERFHLPLGSWVSLAEAASFTFEAEG